MVSLSEKWSSKVMQMVWKEIHKWLLIIARHGMDIKFGVFMLRLILWFVLCGRRSLALCWAQCCQQLQLILKYLSACVNEGTSQERSPVRCSVEIWELMFFLLGKTLEQYSDSSAGNALIFRITGKWKSTMDCWCSFVVEITAGVKNPERQLY